MQWLSSDPGLLELDWLHDLMPSPMAHVNVSHVADELDVTGGIVLITNSVCPYRSVLQRLQQRNAPYGVILLSDEYLRDPCEWLVDDQCLFLARHYVHPAFIDHAKVITFGLGYTRGFVSQPALFKPLQQRRLLWCFAGTPHGDRANAVRLFSQLQPYRVHACSGFLSADGLAIGDYAALLGDSVFHSVRRGTHRMTPTACTSRWRQVVFQWFWPIHASARLNQVIGMQSFAGLAISLS